MNKNNISSIKNCYGCGVCAASCPKNVISINLNDDGFYEPVVVDSDTCIHCGICTDVCAFCHTEIASPRGEIKCWAAWSEDERVRKKCSSGGIGFEIGKQLLEQGYLAIGCRYSIESQRAEHYIAASIDEFIPSIGSKYIQSYTMKAFKQIDRRKKYLVTGTPCQIDSMRRMIHKFRCEENFVLLDFFCHCVPSMYAWRAYLKMVESQIGKANYVSWRNKFQYGWHDSWLMGIDGGKTSLSVDRHGNYDNLIEEKETCYQSRKSHGDLFYRLFLGDLCLNRACEKHCKYKYDKSSADIRIGDLWGKEYNDNELGVSALVAMTQKGMDIICNLKNVTLVEHPFEIVAEGQMRCNARRKELSGITICLLKNGFDLTGWTFKTVFFCQRVITKLKRMMKI